MFMLYIWTLGVETTTDFIFDGFGDDQISHTIFKQDQKVLVQKLTEGYNSLGQTMAMFGAHIGLSGDKLDIPGKVMALKAYGQKVLS